MTLDRFFPKESRERVAAAVRQAEAASLGQIVPVVVERSDRYEEVPWMGGVLLAALATAGAELSGLGVSAWELPFVQLGAGLVGALVARLAPVRRLLAGKGHIEEAVRARAQQAFLEHGLTRTERGTGVLVFASLLEHRAVVLGDHGIHEKMGDEGWQKGVEALVDGIRRGDPAAGFCDAIAFVGARLAQHFPRPPGAVAVNELPDELGTRT
ncbi:MAG TPA: hypothetical protein VFR85_14570 [Anaeromyxobacteraceae bacterium]|nr:hypothetical protein [Anaeromyxobacteraceae bacterium]